MDYRTTLRADCSRCLALCCVALPFERGEWFAFDKAANTRCPRLADDFRCSIHGALTAKGQRGCTAYDCYGAGQRISEELLGGSTRQDGPAVAATVLEAFRRLKVVHELRLLLHEAKRLQLAPTREAERERWLSRLEPEGRLTPEWLNTLDVLELDAAVRTWLRGLARELCPEPMRRRRLPLVPR